MQYKRMTAIERRTSLESNGLSCIDIRVMLARSAPIRMLRSAQFERRDAEDLGIRQFRYRTQHHCAGLKSFPERSTPVSRGGPRQFMITILAALSEPPASTR